MLHEFEKEINFEIRQQCWKSNTDKSTTKLPNSIAIMVSEISTKISSENLNELCDMLRLLFQKIQTGKNSNVIDQEIVALADKLLGYKSITKKQHNFLLLKGLN